MAWDLGSIAVGVVAGIVIGGLVFTASGRALTGAGVRRVAYHVEPKHHAKTRHRKKRK